MAKDATVSWPFFTTKVVFASGAESETPSRVGPPRTGLTEIVPSIPARAGAGELERV
ncbi:MAG: hypothetical protein ACR2FX_06105 [Chthoniobacterales bacterium]